MWCPSLLATFLGARMGGADPQMATSRKMMVNFNGISEILTGETSVHGLSIRISWQFGWRNGNGNHHILASFHGRLNGEIFAAPEAWLAYLGLLLPPGGHGFDFGEDHKPVIPCFEGGTRTYLNIHMLCLAHGL